MAKKLWKRSCFYTTAFCVAAILTVALFTVLVTLDCRGPTSEELIEKFISEIPHYRADEFGYDRGAPPSLHGIITLGEPALPAIKARLLASSEPECRAWAIVLTGAIAADLQRAVFADELSKLLADDSSLHVKSTILDMFVKRRKIYARSSLPAAVRALSAEVLERNVRERPFIFGRWGFEVMKELQNLTLCEKDRTRQLVFEVADSWEENELKCYAVQELRYYPSIEAAEIARRNLDARDSDIVVNALGVLREQLGSLLPLDPDVANLTSDGFRSAILQQEPLRSRLVAQFRSWWDGHRNRVVFDPERRAFLVR